MRCRPLLPPLLRFCPPTHKATLLLGVTKKNCLPPLKTETTNMGIIANFFFKRSDKASDELINNIEKWFKERPARDRQRGLFFTIMECMGYSGPLIAERLHHCVMKEWEGQGVFGELLANELGRLVTFPPPKDALQEEYQRTARPGLLEMKKQLQALDKEGPEFKDTRIAAVQGDAIAQSTMAYMYIHGIGVEKNHYEAFHFYWLAAEQGYAEAQFNLGVMYENGEGIRQDYTEAVKWYLLAAEQGNEKAQNSLGWMYEKGTGVNQDYTESAKFFLLAAEQGDNMAQLNLGIKYASGLGVGKNYAEAAKWYLLAAEQGNEKAQFNIGLMYAYGNGVRQDKAEAVKWWKLAAEEDHAWAQFNLGVAYENGYGVTVNKSRAKEWFGKACDNGLQQGCEEYRKLNELGIK